MSLSHESPGYATNEDWKRARRQVLYRKVVCAVTRCSVQMRSFESIRQLLHLNHMQYEGLQEIPLAQVKGSVGRFDDFTDTFLPRKDHMQERWQKVDQLVIQGKIPPIEVYQVDQAYFVLDGNHRVSAARQNGWQMIRAHVTRFVSPFGATATANIDELFIQTERQRYLEQVGEPNRPQAEDISFTCAGCYRDLTDQIEAYRQGMAGLQEKPVTFEQAYSAWYEEVYLAAVSAIRQEGVLELFPERTEADLFIWAWRNGDELEAQVEADGPET